MHRVQVDVFDAFARARASAEAKAAGQQQEQQKKKSNIQEIKLWKSPPVRGSVVMFEGFDDGLRDWHLSANPKFSGWQTHFHFSEAASCPVLPFFFLRLGL